MQPTETIHPPYFKNYLGGVQAENVDEAINKYSSALIDFFNSIPEEKHLYRYAEDKWTVKEMLQHIIDTERIFAYRALVIARKDKTALPGFDENDYARESEANNRTWRSLVDEFELVRKSTDCLLLSFSPEQLQQVGTTNNYATSTEAVCFIIFGHILHHKNILVERYL